MIKSISPVPFAKLSNSYSELREAFDCAYHRVMESGRYLLGPELENFESEFANYVGVKHAIGVGSGLDALTLLLRAANIGPGDEVIVPANTFIATWLSVSYCGAHPVPVEPLPTTFNLDPAKVEAAITPKTKAIVAVHLYGQPAEMDQLAQIAKKHGCYLFEDTAQAQGATYHAKYCGNLADGAAFSFYPGKNLGAFSDAGAVTTPHQSLADSVKLLRNYGSKEKYAHEIKGVNSRLDELQAAFLSIKLKHLDQWNASRTEHAQHYFARLQNTGLILPSVLENTTPSWHQFVIKTQQRDELINFLAQRNIASLIHYPVPPHKQKAYVEYHHYSLPITEALATQIVSLPIDPFLTTQDIDTVINAIELFYQPSIQRHENA